MISRDETPSGSLLAFAQRNVSPSIRLVTNQHSLFPGPHTRTLNGDLTAPPPLARNDTGLPRFVFVPIDRLAPAYPPVALCLRVTKRKRHLRPLPILGQVYAHWRFSIFDLFSVTTFK